MTPEARREVLADLANEVQGWDLTDEAANDAARFRVGIVCHHLSGRCACRRNQRVTAWLIVDALVQTGWHLTPPTEEGT